MLKIIKKGSNNFWHIFNNGAKNVSISDFEVVLDDFLNTFVIVLRNGANIPQIALSVLDIIVIDETGSGVEETFLTASQLRARLVVLGYTAYLGAGNADSITGLIDAGTNVTITGTGTLADPYIINSSGGSGTTPTLQEVTTEGNETTDEVIFRASADVFVKIDSTTGFIEFWDLTQDAVNAISIINQNYINISDGATSKFEYNPFSNTLSIEDNLFGYVINSNGNIEILDKTTAKSLFVQVPASITDTRTQTYQDSSGTIALTSDITADNADALKRDGSNANSDVNLGVSHSLKASTITIQNNGASKSMKLLASSLNNERTAEFQDKDYTGIADITDIPDVSGKEDISNKSSSYTASSTTTYANTKALVDGLATKQAILSYNPFKFIQTSQTAHTGTTAETIVATATINGGTFNASDVMKVLYGLNKPLTTTGATLRLRINTSNTLTGATLIGGFGVTGTASNTIFKRNFMLNGGNLYGANFSATTIVNDEVNVAASYSNTTYNTANTLYFFFTIQLLTSIDSVTPNLFNITN
jgi:hypothetical protein